MAWDTLVTDVVGAYLKAVDDELPGLMEGLYLEGSAAPGGLPTAGQRR